jgi:uncharacterized RDD family membrane protein YckC
LVPFRLYVVSEGVRFRWCDFERLAFMNCPQCGEICSCYSESVPAFESEPAVAESGEAQAWRDELSTRVNRYRARRKARPPRYPSLSLRFEAFESTTNANAISGTGSLPAYESVSNHALALDGMRQPQPSAAAEATEEVQSPQVVSADVTPVHHSAAQFSVGQASRGQASAKIIEFPRFAWGPPAPPPDQLAEPVTGRPRILDVPEVEPPPPALGGITIETVEHHEVEKRPGIDIPLQSAPFGLRMMAAMVDGIIVAAASAIFVCIFWKVAAVRPPMGQVAGLAIGIPFVFWAAYQYLLIVYSASTPGLRIAGLGLARFDGTPPNRSQRRWRVLAGWLSAVSLGMGYLWVFLDEDALCWHDRITHTHFAPKKTYPSVNDTAKDDTAKSRPSAAAETL